MHVYIECVVPDKIDTHPMEGHWKFLGAGGILRRLEKVLRVSIDCELMED